MKIKLRTRHDESVSIDQEGKTLILDHPSGDEVEIEFKGRTLKIHDVGYKGQISLSLDGQHAWREDDALGEKVNWDPCRRICDMRPDTGYYGDDEDE